MRKIVFVCTGNTCRSPMAEGLFKKYLFEVSIGNVAVDSAGVSVLENDTVCENAVKAAKFLGADISSHKPRNVNEYDFNANTFFVCMSEQQKKYLSQFTHSSKILCLNVDDPFMGNYEKYYNCALQIQSYFKTIVNYFCLDMVICKMKEIDVIKISEIENECFSVPWSYKSILDELTNDKAVFLIAKCDEDTPGYVGSYFVLDEVYITNIAVKSAFRHKGIASELLNKLIELSKKEKSKFITLEVREGNLEAISLYKKFGFLNVGVRNNYYSDPKENAVLMTKYFTKEEK